ncbi:hypothetical protein GGR57DRAFT_114856 [Xylariaceae sp. FL1272]|nr:hypothetical protein GGR57DRAFT_114856 [Xylariaceae sp. FL1272]
MLPRHILPRHAQLCCTITASPLGGRVPKMVLPTLTSSLPMAIAPSKSSLMPMLSSNFLSSPRPSSFITRSRCSRNLTKSSFSFSAVVATDRAIAPMVIRPRRCKFCASSTARQSSTVSEPGAQPDLESSPEVLTCTWMLSFSGADEVKEESSSPRCLSKSCAFFNVSTLETQNKLGIAASFLQWPV